jgi:hypothetical protein
MGVHKARDQQLAGQVNRTSSRTDGDVLPTLNDNFMAVQ